MAAVLLEGSDDVTKQKKEYPVPVWLVASPARRERGDSGMDLGISFSLSVA